MTHNPFWIQTHTPRGSFDLANPRAEDVRIEDIAYALSNLCRFTGHCNRFYSVAQHSIHVAEIVAETNPEWALAALLHDAEEAYIGDLSSPLKALIRSNQSSAVWLHAITQPIERAIGMRFGLFASPPWGPNGTNARHDAIKAADLKMLATERRDLMPESSAELEASWYAATGTGGAVPCEWQVPFYGEYVRELFLARFEQYGGQR